MYDVSPTYHGSLWQFASEPKIEIVTLCKDIEQYKLRMYIIRLAIHHIQETSNNLRETSNPHH